MESETNDTISLIYQATIAPQGWFIVLEQLHKQLELAEADDQTITLLVEHCIRAKKITSQLHAQQEQISTWKHLVDQLPLAVIFVNQKLKVINYNYRAELMIEDSRYISIDNHQQLSLKSSLLEHQLLNDIQKIHNQSAQAMALDEDKTIVLMTVAIKKVEVDIPLMDASAAILIFSVDEKITPELSIIQSLHKLTPSEAKLTQHLCLTHSLSQSAQLSGISLHTARSYLKIIYSKTATNSQLELVRKIVASSVASLGLSKPLTAIVNPDYRYQLKDSRIITWQEFGVPDGEPIVIFENIGGSLPQHHNYQQLYKNKNLKVILIIRPGYGDSSFNPNANFISYADDVISLLKHLKIKKFSLVGYSMGGAYAAVLAAKYPKHINQLFLLSTALPWSYIKVNKLASHQIFMVKLLNKAPELFKYIMSLKMHSAFKNPASFYNKLASQTSSADKQILTNTFWQQQLGNQLKQRLMGGVKAYIHEYLLLTQSWQVDISNIKCPTTFWHGGDDRLVEYENVKTFAALFENAEVKLFSGEGHFMVCYKWPDLIQHINDKTKYRSSLPA